MVSRTAAATAAGVIGTAVGLVACAPRHTIDGEIQGRPPTNAAEPMPYEQELLAAARDYRDWDCVSADLTWALTLCRSLTREEMLGTPRFDRAGRAHGQKLYRLFATPGAWYAGSSANPPAAVPTTTPVGATLIKQSWSVRRIGSPSESRDAVQADGVWYAPDQPRELFVMRYIGPDKPHTDEGWIYALLSADGTKVQASGVIASCAGCHADAPHGRLFGSSWSR